MKKILSIISAGLLVVLAASCNKDEKATFDPSDVTAPVLGAVNVGSDVVVKYTPAVFSMDFNELMNTYHTLGMIAVNDEKCDVTLSNAKDSGSSLTLSGKNMTTALQLRGFSLGEAVQVTIVVRASIQDPSKGVTNGYVDSEDSYTFSWTLKEDKPAGGDPYAGWEKSTWGVTGSIASAGLNWDKDIEMVTDGTWHVAKGVVLTTSDQFKFRKDGGWTDNFGAGPDISEEPYAVTIDAEQPAGAGGKNLCVAEDGTYDLFINPDAQIYKVIVTGSNVVADPYAAFTEASTWSIIGSIASTGNSWNADSAMVTDGTWHVCQGLELAASDQFKFRKDADWGTNFGAGSDISEEPYVVTLGVELPAGAGGKNLAVPEDGTYDLLLNPDAATYKIVVSGEDPQL